MTVVLIVVAYFTIILRLYFLSLMGIITVVVVIVFAFLTIVAVVMMVATSKTGDTRLKPVVPITTVASESDSTTNIPILFVFMICNRRLILNKA